MRIRNCKKCNHVFNIDKFEKCPKCHTPWKANDRGSTMILRGEPIDETYEEKKESTTPFLMHKDKNNEQKKIILENPFFMIGRAKDVDLLYDDIKVSRYHSQILLEEDGCYLVDLNSTNGTFLNDKKLTAEKKYELNSGDIILFYTYECQFFEE